MTIERTYDYHQRMKLFSESFDLNREKTTIDTFSQDIFMQEFHSTAHEFLPDENEHLLHMPAFLYLMKYYLANSEATNREIFHSLKEPDRIIPENNTFTYPIIRSSSSDVSDKVTILFHGLNERFYQKYLPWASTLAEKTNSTVIIFPIAFHMNRSPESWSNIRKMMPVMKERKSLLPHLKASSFANAALSYRVQFSPQRFILSGVHTFFDVIKLLEEIKEGDIPGIKAKAEVNIFAYSIGATLTQVLMMADPKGLLSSTKAFMFCGGAVLDQTTPINKTIIDNEAFESLLIFFEAILDGHVEDLISLGDYKHDPVYHYFKSMLIFDKMEKERIVRFKEISDRIHMICLEKDTVMRPEAVRNSMKDSNIPLEILDFSYPYKHEHPFPLSGPVNEDVERAFELIMNRASVFLNS